ncbi:hypothetical protein [Aquamicrobium sp. LC103]|uniref:HPr kinase/phosphorylase n=1 Tax=Aquamicrobium sp. LC103 TaxID=1120658 RepID=UPI00069CAFC2|nr:hypothetical protein [Aquamicrobium sp. LC103]
MRKPGRQRTNFHATVIVAGGRGIMITGDSGAGKSSLAVSVVRHCHAIGGHAALVSDDQAWLSAPNGRLVAEAPQAIEGLVEIRGYGPAGVPFERRAVVDLFVRLVEEGEVPRFREDDSETVLGVELPCLRLPARNIASATGVLAAWLGIVA